MLIPSLFLIIGATFLLHGWFAIGAAAFAVAAVVLVQRLPGGCGSDCNQGRACTCRKELA